MINVYIVDTHDIDSLIKHPEKNAKFVQHVGLNNPTQSQTYSSSTLNASRNTFFNSLRARMPV